MKFEKLTFCGHSAVIIQGGAQSVAIDPWLEGNPSCPESLKNPESLDLIILTHGHSDHAGDAQRLMRQTSAKLIATWELASTIVAEGVPDSRVIAMNKGGTVESNGLYITLTHAMHSSSYDSATGPVYSGEPCGVVLRDGTTTIYHAGDTALFSDISLIRDAYAPNLALLPIGDRFTMGPKEAAIAAKLTGARHAIPIHYETFPLLTGTAAEFEKECNKFEVTVHALKPGGTLGLRGL